MIELHLGVNYCGRGPANDIQIEHATISTVHCAITLGDGRLLLRDCESTNGTFVDGEQVNEASLVTGQTFHVGEVEVFVESAEVTVMIPEIRVERPAPPVVRKDGSMLCARHPGAVVTHQCTFCREVLCDDCVTKLRRRGGKTLKLCSLCSRACEPLGVEKVKKRSFLGFLQETVKMPFMRPK